MQVEEFLEQSARRHAAKTALVADGRRLAYGELDRRCNLVARGLVALGVARGDRVAVHLENSADAIVAIFAILKAGAIFVMVNPAATAGRVGHVLRSCGAAALVTDPAKLESTGEFLREQPLKAVILSGRHAGPVPMLPVVSLEELAGSGDPAAGPPPKQCIDVDLAALVCTSGTRGEPKHVMSTHLNVVSSATSIVSYLGISADDVILSVLPLAYSYGLYQVLTAFKAGATVILERSFAYPAVVLDRIKREGVTGFPIVPTICARLLQMNLASWDLSGLRYISSAGAVLPVDHIRKLRKLLPRVQIYSMYGQAECSTRASYLPPDQIDIRPASVGRGMPNEELYIVDEHDHRVGPGVVGELVIRGSNVMRGYWGMPEETGKVLRPGPVPGEKVLYSGDLFRMDSEGYLYFVARKDDLIKSRGQKVSPTEVEQVLHRLAGVAEAAVTAVADPVLGHAIKAVIVPRQGAALTRQQVLRHCARHLEDFMVPQFVEFRQEMPRTMSGKVARRVLAGQAEGAP